MAKGKLFAIKELQKNYTWERAYMYMNEFMDFFSFLVVRINIVSLRSIMRWTHCVGWFKIQRISARFLGKDDLRQVRGNDTMMPYLWIFMAVIPPTNTDRLLAWVHSMLRTLSFCEDSLKMPGWYTNPGPALTQAGRAYNVIPRNFASFITRGVWIAHN